MELCDRLRVPSSLQILTLFYFLLFITFIFANVFIIFQQRKLQDMPLSNAERQRRFREKAKNDPDLRELREERERVRWQKRKAAGKVKEVKDMTEREHRRRKRQWKLAQNKSRNMKRNLEAIPSPPSTPLNAEPVEMDLQASRSGSSRQVVIAFA